MSIKTPKLWVDFETRTILAHDSPSSSTLAYAIVFKTQKERTAFIERALQSPPPASDEVLEVCVCDDCQKFGWHGDSPFDANAGKISVTHQAGRSEEVKQRLSYLHECYRNQRPPTYETVTFFESYCAALGGGGA